MSIKLCLIAKVLKLKRSVVVLPIDQSKVLKRKVNAKPLLICKKP